MFLGKYCDLTAIEDDRGMNLVSSLRSQDLDLYFPFTEADSIRVCLKSALAISRGYESLSPVIAHPDRPQSIDPEKTSTTDDKVRYLLPFFACSAMQSSYVLLMCHYRLRAALVSENIALCHHLLNTPVIDSEVQDVERSMREIRQGLEAMLDAMRGAQIFEGVGGMIHEIRIACQSATLDS